ncbi:MAG: diadenylate cyclase CdaA [Acutalibacteraceae bacterium]
MDYVQSFISSFLSLIKTFSIVDAIDIIAISIIIYSLFKLVRDTRAEQLVKGIVMLLVIYFLSMLLGLRMMTSLLRVFFEFGVILIVVVFQPEIRSVLEQLGRNKISKKYLNIFSRASSPKFLQDIEKKAIIDVADAANIFSSSKTGALIVFERETKLSDIAKSGTYLDCETSPAILGNIFFNKAPLHDGAVIIKDGRVHSAGCILPLVADNNRIDINLGTRHRAAVGMSENSDAVVLVVSEETGVISLAVGGTLYSDFTRDSLVLKLQELLINEDLGKSNFFSKFSDRKKEKENE